MKTSMLVILGLSLLSFTVQANEPGFKWSRQTLKLIDSGDVDKGKALAKQHKCDKCHGDNGVSEEDDTPSIAGQMRSYHFKQLVDYKTGVRDERTMAKKVRVLTPEQMADLAAYYEAQKGEVPPRREAPVLATKGDEKRLLLSCDVCHGEGGKGYGLESPVIRGQKIEYFTDIMTAFKEGDRENDHYGRMRYIASILSEEEIEQLAAYYSMPPAPE
jgi:cytochrome c553